MSRVDTWGINEAKNSEESAPNYTGGAGQCGDESWDHDFQGYCTSVIH